MFGQRYINFFCSFALKNQALDPHSFSKPRIRTRMKWMGIRNPTFFKRCFEVYHIKNSTKIKKEQVKNLVSYYSEKYIALDPDPIHFKMKDLHLKSCSPMPAGRVDGWCIHL